MPRSLTRPQVGTVVWYYAAAPPVAGPLPATVIAAVATAGTGIGSPPPTFDLFVIAIDGTTSKVAAVPFYYGTRPTTGAWCTMPRTFTPPAGVWPSQASEAGAALLQHGVANGSQAAAAGEGEKRAPHASLGAAYNPSAAHDADDNGDDDDDDDDDLPPAPARRSPPAPQRGRPHK
jgi:hypothetical protein